MRNLLIIPLIVFLFAGGVWGIAHVMGWPHRLGELATAAVLCAVSGELSLFPAMRAQRSGPAAVSQASLIGTVIHMFLTLVLAAIVWVAHVMTMQRHTFVYLLLMFYWISLIGLVIALVRIIRSTAALAVGRLAGGNVS